MKNLDSSNKPIPISKETPIEVFDALNTSGYRATTVVGKKAHTNPYQEDYNADAIRKELQDNPKCGVALLQTTDVGSNSDYIVNIDVDSKEASDKLYVFLREWELEDAWHSAPGWSSKKAPYNQQRLFKLSDPHYRSQIETKTMISFLPGEPSVKMEMRRHNRYSVLPPSIHPETGKPYEWLVPLIQHGKVVDIPELPQKLYKLWVDNMPKKSATFERKVYDNYEPIAVIKDLFLLLPESASQDYDSRRNLIWSLAELTGSHPEALEAYIAWEMSTIPNVDEQKIHKLWESLGEGDACVNRHFFLSRVKQTIIESKEVSLILEKVSEPTLKFLIRLFNRSKLGSEKLIKAYMSQRYIYLESWDSYVKPRSSGMPITADKSMMVNGSRIKHYLEVFEKGDKILKEYKDMYDFYNQDGVRKVYDDFDYTPIPPGEIDKNKSKIYNLFRGFAYTPKKHGASEQAFCDKLKQHLYYNLCSEDDIVFTYFWKFICHLIQKPHIKPKTAIAMVKSPHGAGKSFVLEFLAKLIGLSSYSIVSDPEFQSFNGQLATNLLVNIDEPKSTKPRQLYEYLKKGTGNTVVVINEKYQPEKTMKSYTRYIITGNNTPFTIDGDDVRFLIPKVRGKLELDIDLAKEVHGIIQAEKGNSYLDRCCEHFMSIAMSEDVSPEVFDIRRAPMSSVKAELKLKSTKLTYKVLSDMVEDGYNSYKKCPSSQAYAEMDGWKPVIKASDVFRYYLSKKSSYQQAMDLKHCQSDLSDILGESKQHKIDGINYYGHRCGIPDELITTLREFLEITE